MPEENEETTNESAPLTEASVDELISGLESRLLENLEEKLGDRFDSIADRRVNAILKEVRKREEKPEEKPVNETPQQGPSESELRIRRGFLKTSIQNQVLMTEGLTKKEQQLVLDLAQKQAGLVNLDDVDDEAELAAEIVKTATGTLEGARDVYQEMVREELKARGLKLDDEEEEEAEQPGRRPGLPGGAEAKTLLDAGAERAKAMGLSRKE